eukprot:1822133-Pyramimonas_sp.AAC.1
MGAVLAYVFFFFAVLSALSRSNDLFQVVSSVSEAFRPSEEEALMVSRGQVEDWLGEQVRAQRRFSIAQRGEA